MTERLSQPSGSGSQSARRRLPRPRAGRIWGARTIPAATARELAAESEPTILGFPAEVVDDPDTGERSAGVASSDAPRDLGLVVVRRVDHLGGAALVLAGVPANVSLLVPWWPDSGPTGLSLVQSGVDGIGIGPDRWALIGLWQPFVVVVSGGLLVLLGLLLLVPARAHRLVGVLALVVTLVAATAVGLLVAEIGGGPDRFGPGMWCAVAVPVLGAVGSLKAMLTPPQVALGPR
jgi:hypothetical protein